MSTVDIYSRILKKVADPDPAAASLVERQLAAELGVSRVPVRESLAKLVAQGVLVASDRGGGVRLREYSHEEIRQLFELRAMIQGGMAYAVAKVAAEEQIDTLDLVADLLDKTAATSTRADWLEQDSYFHMALADYSRNERFALLMTTLLAECHRVAYAGNLTDKPDRHTVAQRRRVIEEKRQLIALLRRRDAQQAQDLAIRHMREAGRRVIERLVESDLGRKKRS